MMAKSRSLELPVLAYGVLMTILIFFDQHRYSRPNIKSTIVAHTQRCKHKANLGARSPSLAISRARPQSPALTRHSPLAPSPSPTGAWPGGMTSAPLTL